MVLRLRPAAPSPDVSKLEQVVAAVDHAHQTLGGFDIIINNAGVAQIDALLDVTPEQVDRTLRINVQGTLWGTAIARSCNPNPAPPGTTPAPPHPPAFPPGPTQSRPHTSCT